MAKKASYNSLGNSAVFKGRYDYPGVRHKRKYSCLHYDPESGMCNKQPMHCVGPGNGLCKSFTRIDTADTQKQERIGQNAQFSGDPWKEKPAKKEETRRPVKHKQPAKTQGQPKAADPKPDEPARAPVKPAFPIPTLPKPGAAFGIQLPKPKVDVSGIGPGTRVSHKNPKIGEGIVIRIDVTTKRIYVGFRDGERMFDFPGVFDNGLLKKKE